MSIARHHAEWLSLVEVSGPFLSMPVLLRVFPQGLDAHDPEISRALRLAYEEWQDNQQSLRPDPAIHQAWVRFLLRDVLGFTDDLIAAGPAIPEGIKATVAEHGETLRPDLAIRRENDAPRILVQIVPPTQDLEKPLQGQRWKASPATRMAELLRATGIRLGLVTNGERWMLVHAQPGETAGFISWYASLWLDEPLTLRAFRSLLDIQRTFGVPASETLDALLTESASNQQEVTDQLGYQVREAVEMLVQTIDRIDKDRGRTLLAGISETQLYEAALTVMMRLVFLLSAEERGLLRLGKPLYDQYYAVSTLRAQLRAVADATGEEVLERRYDAWSRLLATFRAVHGGVQHEDLRLPAYGGALFDPERFPFLEGRSQGLGNGELASAEIKASLARALKSKPHVSEATTSARYVARPLPVDNRTVLHLLEALQILRVSVPGGGPAEPRRLSFRALDIEQIGHVYEGLLDHTAKRASEPILGLTGTKDREPEVPLSRLEALAGASGMPGIPGIGYGAEPNSTPDTRHPTPDTLKPLINFLRDETGRSASAIEKALNVTLDARDLDALRAVCDNNAALVARVRPFAGLLRRDTFGRPVVITTGSVYVTAGTDRRSSGTHYTPRSLTEPIVQHTLDPLVYYGPAEGLPKEQWRLHSADRILSLQVCDMAMGSGAFLVQACRYLSERLVESIESEESSHQDARTPTTDHLRGYAALRAIADPEEKLATARKLIADRCLYGVDKNPLAVEMAKLSLWLITLQKDRPFSFLDHALRCGDSLLGISDVDQLLHWSLARDPGPTTATFLTDPLRRALQRALALRRKIRETPVIDVRDAEQKAVWLREADETMGLVKLAADLLVAAQLHKDKKRRTELSDEFQYRMSLAADAWESMRLNATLRPNANNDELAALRREADDLLDGRRPFHWPLEFPEVFLEEARPVDLGSQQALMGFGAVHGPLFEALEEQSLDQQSMGFAAIVGNPPFQGGQKITGALGVTYRDYLVDYLANRQRGSADLCAYFFLRAGEMLQANGMSGLLATNTIAQGDTREVGLDQLMAQGFTIPRAVPSRRWPGIAAVEVAHVWLRRGASRDQAILDEKPVTAISPFLTVPGVAAGNPYRLKANEGKSFQGSIVLGMGFVLEPDEAQSLIARDPRNKEALFPYLNGEDLNSRPDQSPSRWVINFHDWPLERAETYPDLMAIVREKVKPERDKNNRAQRREKWWQYAERAPALYATIAGIERVLVTPLVSKFMLTDWQPINQVFSHALGVIASDTNSMFALIQCTFHEEWARTQGSTLETRMRYTPSDCFETFPFPTSLMESSRQDAKRQRNITLRGFAASRETLEHIGEHYHTHRQQIMLSRQEGLTKTYNRFHNPAETSDDIAELRRLHVEMDNAVAAAYGWKDLDLGHGFHETKQGLHYTISEAARRTVLDRLLALNHERYNAEVAAGLHDKGAKKAAGKGKRGKQVTDEAEQGELF